MNIQKLIEQYEEEFNKAKNRMVRPPHIHMESLENKLNDLKTLQTGQIKWLQKEFEAGGSYTRIDDTIKAFGLDND